MLIVDTAVIGGGIVGLATAMALSADRSVAVVEAENRLAAHQTGRNSGVVHSGLYYRPGSLKARLCAEGREAMYEFCRVHGVPHERCGKLVVATDEQALARLDELEQRGRANGLQGLKRLSAAELAEREPHARGIAALLVPDTGIADFARAAQAMASVLQASGGQVLTGHRVEAVRREAEGLLVQTSQGELRCGSVIACAGLQADRVARLCGLRPECRIIPFRGEYRRLAPHRTHLVRHLIYPVPDPRVPFLGVHLTRRIAADGAARVVEAGPSAALTFNRSGYRRWTLNAADAIEVLAYRGFWRMVARTWRTGVQELHQSMSARSFARAAQQLVPDLKAEDLEPVAAGVRAMVVDPDGTFADDFRILRGERMVHVLNAPSPAATASISIGRHIAALAKSYSCSPRGT